MKTMNENLQRLSAGQRTNGQLEVLIELVKAIRPYWTIENVLAWIDARVLEIEGEDEK